MTDTETKMRELAADITKRIREGFTAGSAAERAAVVAYLRAGAEAYVEASHDPDRHESAHAEYSLCAEAMTKAANKIERGEHRSGEGGGDASD